MLGVLTCGQAEPVLVNTNDGTPIVAELEIGGDQNLLHALIQGLTHVVAL